MEQKEMKILSKKMLEKCKSSFDKLDKLDAELHTQVETPTSEQILKIARQTAGLGNFILKYCSKIRAVRKREELSKYLKVKISTTEKGKFSVTGANREALAYVNDLMITEEIFSSYIESVHTVLSVCRMHISVLSEDKQINAHL